MNQYGAVLLSGVLLVVSIRVASAVTHHSPDTDFDGLSDVREALLGTDPWLTDTDGDGLSDKAEVGADPEHPVDTDGDRRINALDIDDDNDGIPTVLEAKQDSDGDGVVDYLDMDSDNDGRSDYDEAGLLGTDADHDGLDDTFDVDFSQMTDDNGDGVDDYRLLPDSDADGVADVLDVLDDGGAGDLDGDGLSNLREQQLGSSPLAVDSDGDGVPDNIEAGTGSVLIDTDQDGLPDIMDSDDDGDGVPTQQEVPGLPVPPHYLDTDADGVPNYLDADDDGDGVASIAEDLNGNGDLSDDDRDGDGIADYLDYLDEDGPGNDRDHDGLSDYREMVLGSHPAGLDTDADGIADELEIGFDESTPVDSDSDGIFDFLDQDDDGDGLPTVLEGERDRDNDGRVNYLDADAAVYFYCAADGRIISEIDHFTVLPMAGVAVQRDGYGWRWQFRKAGIYTLKFTLPEGMSLFTPAAGLFRHEGLADARAEAAAAIISLGRGEDILHPGYLADFDPADLPRWYQQFQISNPTQQIINLNIPLQGGICPPVVIERPAPE